MMAMMDYSIVGSLYAHSISYILTLKKGLAHGAGCALALPFTIKLYEPYIQNSPGRLTCASPRESTAIQLRQLYLASGLPEDLQASGCTEKLSSVAD